MRVPGREVSREAPERTRFGPLNNRNAAEKGGDGIVSMRTKR